MKKEYVNLEFSFGNIPEPVESDDMIYHYCSMNTLDAILKSKKVRLYDLLSMNDTSELQLRRINFAKRLFDYFKKNPFDFEYEANGFKGDFESYLFPQGMNYQLTHGGLFTVLSFALCMSSKCNSLSQWRLYGNDGRGVCLGFDKNLINEFLNNNDNFSIHKVQYIDDFYKLIDSLVEEKYFQIKALCEKCDNEKLLEIQHTLFDDIYWEASKYKVGDYSNEDEIRLVYQQKEASIMPNASPTMLKNRFDDNSIDLDIIRDDLRIFKTIDVEHLGLKSIVLGPRNNTSKQMINLLLAKRNFVDDISVYKSYIPYRG